MARRVFMKKIVITGGVGAGKSEVLSVLSKEYNCKVVRADDVAKDLMKPGEKCYSDIVKEFRSVNLFPDDLSEDSNSNYPPFDKDKLSFLIFSDDNNRKRLNAIVHPAVKEYILEDVRLEEETGKYDYYFLETALAIEEKYNELFDETWYIYADEEVRRERLMNNRGYSSEKMDEIFASQLSDEEFRRFATKIIDNSASLRCQDLRKDI